MAADMVLHALTVPEDVFDAYYKYDYRIHSGRERKTALDQLCGCPRILIGETSLLKAGLVDNPSTFIPGVVEFFMTLLGRGLTLVDDNLLQKVTEYFLAPKVNISIYKREGDRWKILQFLNEHKGKKVFLINY